MARQAKHAAKPAAPKATPVKSTARTSKAVGLAATPQKLIPSEEQIRARAYQKWEAAGKPDSDGMGFWLEAERELREGM